MNTRTDKVNEVIKLIDGLNKREKHHIAYYLEREREHTNE